MLMGRENILLLVNEIEYVEQFEIASGTAYQLVR